MRPATWEGRLVHGTGGSFGLGIASASMDAVKCVPGEPGHHWSSVELAVGEKSWTWRGGEQGCAGTCWACGHLS